MNIDRLVFAIAGIFILSSVLLSIYHNQNWLWFTGFVEAPFKKSAKDVFQNYEKFITE